MPEPERPVSATLRGRALIWASVLLVALVGLMGLITHNTVRSLMIDQLAESLRQNADVVGLVTAEATDIEEAVAVLADALDARVTLLSLDGDVLADSVGIAQEMDDHSDRPEVMEALTGVVGRSQRLSATTGDDRLYVAVLGPGDQITRLSVTDDQIDAEVNGLSARIAAIAVAIGIIGLGSISFAVGKLVQPISELTEIATASVDREPRTPRRSSISEFDRLGLAIHGMAALMGRRIVETDAERQSLGVILGALSDGVLLIESDDRISYVNPAARSFVGSVPEELNKLAPAAFQRLVRSGRSSGTTASILIEIGNPARIVSASTTPFPDGRVLLRLVDDTERQRVESIRRDFVADASHELKTPVATILASMETLRMAMDRGSERAADFADQIEASARRLAQIVEDLLDLSRLEASETLVEVVHLDAVVVEEIKRLQPTALGAGVDLVIELDPVVVRGSVPDLALAVRNLCENAVQYTDRGGSVSVRLHSDGGEALLEVTDTGRGIPTRALGRVFERFYRVDVARSRDTGGTGLGLAIVKHVAERHGGVVTVDSQLGAGSTFVLSLPAVEDFQGPE